MKAQQYFCYLFFTQPTYPPTTLSWFINNQQAKVYLFTFLYYHYLPYTYGKQDSLSLVIHLFIAYLTKTIQDHFVTNSVMKTEEDLYMTLRQDPKIWSPLYRTEDL